jgi:hypothetical protein
MQSHATNDKRSHFLRLAHGTLVKCHAVAEGVTRFQVTELPDAVASVIAGMWGA